MTEVIHDNTPLIELNDSTKKLILLEPPKNKFTSEQHCVSLESLHRLR